MSLATAVRRHLTDEQISAYTSPGDRRLLINSYSAADSVSLVVDTTHSLLFGEIVRGRPARAVRREAGEIRMPPDFSRGYTSIYELQLQTAPAGGWAPCP